MQFLQTCEKLEFETLYVKNVWQEVNAHLLSFGKNVGGPLKINNIICHMPNWYNLICMERHMSVDIKTNIL